MSMSAEYRAATETAAFFDLSECSKIELAGRDSRSFLHNLCTQEMLKLPVGSTAEAFLTTTKARVVAHFWVTPTADDLLRLDMVPGMAEKVLSHLNHFLISERVELTDRTGELAMLRVVGPAAKGLAAAGSRPHRLLGLDGFDWFGPSEEAAEMRRHLTAAGAVPAGAETYQTLRIEAGLPEYGIDIDDNRLAMEAGRTAEAICYTKGCYLGQETIVMARDRGQVNRMLKGVNVADGPALTPGTKLFRVSDEVGQVTSSVISPRLGHAIALAYLRRGSWDPGTQILVDPATDGRPATVANLPFDAEGRSA